VSDTVAGFLRVGETPGIEGETFNLGSGSEIRVGDLAEEIIALVGRPVEIVIDEARLRPEKSEVQRLLSDNRRAGERLGWQPRVSLRQGLKETIAWIEKNIRLYRPGRYQV
jgi:dTDP-glucose 4,6-dehydratase